VVKMKDKSKKNREGHAAPESCESCESTAEALSLYEY
jgi:hypothetical protein